MENNEGRKLICRNDVIDYLKGCNPLSLKIFYNMLYIYKEQSKFKQNEFEDDEYTHMEISKLDGYIGEGHWPKNKIGELIINMPKEIFTKRNGKIIFLPVFSVIIYDEYYDEFRYKINEEFKPYLDDVMKEFTILELRELATLNSAYSLRLFEFASKNKNLTDYKMKIEDFRNYFQIPSTYRFTNIDQRVIGPMLNEVNTKTNFNVSINKIKSKNKVTHILFKLGVKKKEEEKKSSAKRKEEEPF